ncbi:Major facilitator superfamily like protein [Aduncisulcus paluster]|uniref:Major facilitator superfamily like protein n=1 Tax=Aduncisulcus paluster TaxID=2918883 RepID=A0ABQ5JTB4_9EUKA|nr:Major facilitator superfamily like protein [Aduncisulcus paluster]
MPETVLQENRIKGDVDVTEETVVKQSCTHNIFHGPPPKYLKRWMVAVGAVLLHMSIGSVYAWSCVKSALDEKYEDEDIGMQITFSIAIFFLGMSAAFAGTIIDRVGPVLTSLVSSILYPLGMILLGFFAQIEKGSTFRWLAYVSYGVVGGIGLGFGYVSPVSTLVKWFPDRRGFATGIAVCGFGGGSLIMTYLVMALQEIKVDGEELDIGVILIIMGCLYLVFMLVATFFFIRLPAPGYAPEGYIPKSIVNRTPECQKKIVDWWTEKVQKKEKRNWDLIKVVEELTGKQAIKTWQFFNIWLVLFLNIHTGISFLAFYHEMVKNIFGEYDPIEEEHILNDEFNSTLLALTAVANMGGRFFWAFLSDYIGRKTVFCIFGFLACAIMGVLPTFVTNYEDSQKTGDMVGFIVLFFILYTVYGGGYAVLPATLADVFGTKNVASVHGFILTAWATAGLVGPIWASAVVGDDNDYQTPMYIMCGLSFIEFILALLMKELPAKEYIDPNADLEKGQAKEEKKWWKFGKK